MNMLTPEQMVSAALIRLASEDYLEVLGYDLVDWLDWAMANKN